MLKNHINDKILAVLDIVFFLSGFPIYLFAALICCRLIRQKKDEGINALFLPSSGSIGEVINKFGSLETLNEHNPQGFFSRVIICFFPTMRFFCKPYSESMEIYDFRYVKRFKCLSIMVYLISLVYISRKKNISMVRSLSPYTVGFIGRIVSLIINVPFCVSLHEDDDRRYRLLGKGGERIVFGSRRLALLMKSYVYKTADMILPIRESLRENVIKSGVDKSKVFVVPHGVDTKLFDNLSGQAGDLRKKILASGVRKKIIVSVCRHSMDNYMADMIESAKCLANSRNDFLYILVGDGPLHYEAKRLISLYGLSSLLVAPGYVSRQDAIQYWLIADIGVCLMGGYSLIEAAMAAKPVIAYDVEWHYELVINKKTGFLIKENDIPGVVDAMEALLDDEERRINYGINIKQLAIQKHSLKFTEDIKIACYKKLLKLG